MADATITWLRPDGSGGARLSDGRTLRVDGALPGDVISWRETNRRGRTVHGTVESIVDPSPARIEPPCPWDAACGGCDLSAMHHEARAGHQSAMLSAVFHQRDVVVHPAPSPVGHRARITLAIENGLVGYRGAGSHDLVRVSRCDIAHHAIQAALPRLREVLAGCPDPGLTKVELRTDGERVVYAFHTKRGVEGDTLNALATLGDVAVDGGVRHGDPTLWIPVGALRLRASPSAFFQVHLTQNVRLVEAVVDRVTQARPERVLDLYAGIGNFALPIAKAGVPVAAVELGGAALKDLRASADRADVAHRVVTHATPAERYDVATEPFDVAVLDPPRAGAGDVLGRVLSLRPKRVIYVACQPTAAARDLRKHLGDYRLTEVFGVDLFPQTHHVEAVLVLDRP